MRFAVSSKPILPFTTAPEATAVVAMRDVRNGFGEWILLNVGELAVRGNPLVQGLNATVDDRGLDFDGDEVTNIEEYMYGLES